ncbi:MAG: PAS domain-containing protein [Pirellulaceae bacterium]
MNWQGESRELPVIRSAVWLAYGVGAAAAFTGAMVFAGWVLLGPTVLRLWFGPIYMKTNAAVALLLAGVGLMLLIPTQTGSVRRWAGRVCAAAVLLLGALTLSQHLFGWNLGIDQLLARESPGAAAVTSPNRMGPPASLNFALAGSALLLLSYQGRHAGRRRAASQVLAVMIIMVAFLPAIGYLYGANELYGIARYTGIARPMAMALLGLGIGILCARPHDGWMAAVTADDPGGAIIRSLLLPVILLPLTLGWLRLVGEREGLYEAALGTAIMTLIVILALSALIYHAGRRANLEAAAQQESEVQFRTMADAIPQLAWIARADGHIHWYNQRWHDYMGSTPEQMEGWGWQSVHDPDELPRVLDRWKSSLATGEPFEMTFPLRGADGVSRAFLTRVMPLTDAQGRVQQWFGTNTDVSEQKRVEESLRASESRLRLAQQAARIGTFEWNIRTGVVFWSPELEAMYGLAAGSFSRTQSAWESLVYQEDRAAARGSVQRAFETGEPAEGEWRVVWPDESIHWVFGRFQVLNDPSGQPLLLTGVNMDITERKRAEEALCASEERLRLVLQASAMGTFELDLATGEVHWNATEFELLGLRPGDVPPTPEAFFRFVHPEDVGPLQAQWEEASRLGQFDAEFRIIRADGELRWLAAKGRSIFADRDTSEGRGPGSRFMGVNFDITERKVAEERIRASLGEKEVLLKEIHHRVKNNMQVISSLVALQAERLPEAAMRVVLADVAHRVRSMALVHEKLYESADLGRVDFAEYARTLLTYLWRAHAGTASGIRLALDLEPVFISVNAAVPCGLILNELATNTLKHAFRGQAGGEVAVSLRGAPEGRVCLRVGDNGVGLPEGLDWRRADSLGLRLLQLLATQLRATVEITNTKGTEITVTFGEANP